MDIVWLFHGYGELHERKISWFLALTTINDQFPVTILVMYLEHVPILDPPTLEVFIDCLFH